MASEYGHISKLAGYAPAVPTPFNENGNVDEVAFQHFCDRQIKKGAIALVVCGTTGESPTLTLEEHRRIIWVAVKCSRKRVPVIAGAGSNSTNHAMELAKNAQDAGADAILSVVPYYNKPNQLGLYGHFSAIMEAARLPLILYDVPSRTACGLADATIVRLAENKRCVGLKDATGDITRPLRLRPILKPEFRLFTGDDASALGYFAYGGDGCISVTSNIAPSLCQGMYLAFSQGQPTLAQYLASLVGRLTAALFTETNPVATKYALSLMNMMSERVRLPLVEAREEIKKEITRVLMQTFDECPDGFIGEPINALRGHVQPARALAS